MDVPRQRPTAFSLLAILCLGCFAFAQQIGDQGWVSDDYIEVLNNGFVPCTTLSNTLKFCGNGHYSVDRLLGLPAKLYGGYWLGPVGAHWLQFILHLACAILFFQLLKLLRFSAVVSTLAAVSFVSAPWISQAVIWWATMITPAGTLCILAALYMYVQMLCEHNRRWFSMPSICVLIIVGLSFYELWLFVPVLFVVVSMYLSLDCSPENRFWKRLRSAAINAWPVFATVLGWAIAYKLTVFENPRQGHLVLSRAVIVFFSLHARIYWWITRAAWISPFRDGLRDSHWWWIALSAGLFCLFQILSSTDKINSDRRPLRQLLLGVFLAWGFYVSSKLVFVFSGGVAEHTRQNYGAAMGSGLVVGLLFEYFTAKLASHKIIKLCFCIAVLIACSALAITSAGIRHHYVETSRAERSTIDQLMPVAKLMNPADTLIVCGSGTQTQGELSYFSEDTGGWLQRWLRKANPSLTCFVVPTLKTEGDDIVIHAYRPPDFHGDLRIKSTQARIFQWINGQLKQVN